VIERAQRDALWTETSEHWIAYGMAGSIWDSLQAAATRMIDFVAECCNITPADALLALSSVGDLRLCSVPGEVYSSVVRAEMPKSADPLGRLTLG
jgi:acetamidase/formamidase